MFIIDDVKGRRGLVGGFSSDVDALKFGLSER